MGAQNASNLDAPIKANHAYFLVFAQWGQLLYDLAFRSGDFKYSFILYIENLENISRTCELDIVTDFSIKLGMKSHMHLVEICIFSLNHVIVRLTKIMNNLLEHLKLSTFKVIFLC